MFGIKRPKSIDEICEKHQGEVTTNVFRLERQGWAIDGIKVYSRYINKNVVDNIPYINMLLYK